MTIIAQILNGQVVLPTPLSVPDGTPVRIEVALADNASDAIESDTSLLERMQSVVGIAKGLPKDASRNVDHYLYGHPQK